MTETSNIEDPPHKRGAGGVIDSMLDVRCSMLSLGAKRLHGQSIVSIYDDFQL